MLLYSTILDINENLTQDDFIQLVIKWNQGSPHKDGVIKNLEWNGERTVQYGDDWISLSIQEYRNRNIIATRYKKKDTEGAIWYTDFVMNFDEMRMAIQLYRSYTENAFILSSKFSTPYFLKMLIEKGYVRDDGNLLVSNSPITINEDNAQVLIDIINGVKEYKLPVVYVSKTFHNESPVIVEELAAQLKGTAHILVEESPRLSAVILDACADKNEYNGSVGVYYPNRALLHKSFHSRDSFGAEASLTRKIIRNVIQYGLRQNIDELYTWQGVNNSLLKDRLQSQSEKRLAAEAKYSKTDKENSELSELADEIISSYQEQNEQLQHENDRLKAENEGLHRKMMSADREALLYTGDEDDFYPGELTDILLESIEKMLSNTEKGSRKETILRDVLEANDFKRLGEQKGKKLKAVLKGHYKLTQTEKKELEDLGFVFNEVDKTHYKVRYYGDSRYQFTLAKTSSDNRAGANIAAEMIKKVF